MANNDQKAATDHRETYESFMAMTKWGVILIVIALLLMAILPRSLIRLPSYRPCT